MAMITETRDVRDFDEVVVQGRGDLILEQGDVESVVIEADAAVMPHVKAAVEGRRLVLGLEHWWDSLLFPLAPLRFRVSAVMVNRVTISGSGSVRAEALRSDDLRLEISGSGDMAFPQLTAGAVSLGISGGGKMKVSGEAESVAVRISGSGNVQTGELATQAAEVRISGSGNVKCQRRADAGCADQRLRHREIHRAATDLPTDFRLGQHRACGRGRHGDGREQDRPERPRVARAAAAGHA